MNTDKERNITDDKKSNALSDETINIDKIENAAANK